MEATQEHYSSYCRVSTTSHTMGRSYRRRDRPFQYCQCHLSQHVLLSGQSALVSGLMCFLGVVLSAMFTADVWQAKVELPFKQHFNYLLSKCGILPGMMRVYIRFISSLILTKQCFPFTCVEQLGFVFVIHVCRRRWTAPSM